MPNYTNCIGKFALLRHHLPSLGESCMYVCVCVCCCLCFHRQEFDNLLLPLDYFWCLDFMLTVQLGLIAACHLVSR